MREVILPAEVVGDKDQIKTEIGDKHSGLDVGGAAVQPVERVLLTEMAGFASIAVFAKAHLPDYTRLPFGVHHKAFFKVIPRGERGQKMNILAPRGSGKSTVITVK